MSWGLLPYLVVALVDLGVILLVLIRRRQLTSAELPNPLDCPLREPWPLVTAVVPVRNEAENIEACVRSLLRLEPPLLEILVVDDGSTDETISLLEALLHTEPRVRLLRADTAMGWSSGKARALWSGAQQAHGDWLLFTDADTRHDPGSLYRVLSWCRKHGVEAFSCGGTYTFPDTATELLETTLYFMLTLGMPLQRIEDPEDPLAWINGQYVLIESAAYRRIGGHQAVAKHISEDMALARLVKAAKVKLAFKPRFRAYHCKNYNNVWSAMAGWTRILAMGSPWIGLGRRHFLLSVLILLGLPMASPFMIPSLLLSSCSLPACMLAVFLFGSFAGTALGLRHALGLPLWKGILWPLGAALALTVYVRAFVARFLHGEVVFKGRRAPITAPGSNGGPGSKDDAPKD
ncbi:MAG: hypothetical protein A2284_12505 [Deltaproteobacteria bacterium RIFOXYA12_FULL_61_11]|nr:MAG: hypothetical protein A2284_12505 [Deltaproteobacteria bacterium RIFOXYA12_FULL_61_11]